MILAQQILFWATATCLTVAHQPRADVAHVGHGDIAAPQTLSTQSFTVPVVVDVLRGQRGNRPLLGETPLATIQVDQAGTRLEQPGQVPVPLSSLPCLSPSEVIPQPAAPQKPTPRRGKKR